MAEVMSFGDGPADGNEQMQRMAAGPALAPIGETSSKQASLDAAAAGKPAAQARPGTASGMMGVGPAVDPNIAPKSCAAFAAIGGDKVFYAASKLRRREYADCVAICSEILERNPYDQAVWYLKCQALTAQAWIDDTEMEDEGAADMLLDQNAMAEAPRPGTSLARPLGTAAGAPSMSVRPMTGSGRPVTGYARPGTGSRPGTGTSDVGKAMQGNRPGTSRPVTSGGRFVRLGTASMLSEPGGPFINIERLDLKKYAQRPALAKILCDYIIYQLHNPRKALELASLATVAAEYKDWWWKARLGKCYYQLGLLRDAEKQFQSVLKENDMVVAVLELCKVYIKLDQPNTALDVYRGYSERHPVRTQSLRSLPCASHFPARVHVRWLFSNHWRRRVRACVPTSCRGICTRCSGSRASTTSSTTSPKPSPSTAKSSPSTLRTSRPSPAWPRTTSTRTSRSWRCGCTAGCCRWGSTRRSSGTTSGSAASTPGSTTCASSASSAPSRSRRTTTPPTSGTMLGS